METFFSTLKTSSPIRSTARPGKREPFDYIEASYNPRHRHSTLGYVSPPNSSVASLPLWSWDGAKRVTHSIATMNEPLRMPQERFS